MKKLALFVACLAASSLALAEEVRTMTVAVENGQPIKVQVSNVSEISFAIEPVYTVKVTENNEEVVSGTITGEGKYLEDEVVVLSVTPNTGRYFEYWLDNGVKDFNQSHSITVKNDTEIEVVFSEDQANGYDYVDLGLSVMWATCNIGATSEEEPGDYFAWGETKPKEEYSWQTYTFYDEEYPSDGHMTKYNSTDYLPRLQPEDDAAKVNWGGAWRTPTIVEWNELFTECTWQDVNEEAGKGWKVTSKKAGFEDKSIFVPITSYYCETGFVQNRWENGDADYWASTININPEKADDVWFRIDNPNKTQGSANRFWGMPIRPVIKITEQD